MTKCPYFKDTIRPIATSVDGIDSFWRRLVHPRKENGRIPRSVVHRLWIGGADLCSRASVVVWMGGSRRRAAHRLCRPKFDGRRRQRKRGPVAGRFCGDWNGFCQGIGHRRHDRCPSSDKNGCPSSWNSCRCVWNCPAFRHRVHQWDGQLETKSVAKKNRTNARLGVQAWPKWTQQQSCGQIDFICHNFLVHFSCLQDATQQELDPQYRATCERLLQGTTGK